MGKKCKISLLLLDFKYELIFWMMSLLTTVPLKFLVKLTKYLVLPDFLKNEFNLEYQLCSQLEEATCLLLKSLSLKIISTNPL